MRRRPPGAGSAPGRPRWWGARRFRRRPARRGRPRSCPTHVRRRGAPPMWAAARSDVRAATLHTLHESDVASDRSRESRRVQSACRAHQCVWDCAHHDRRRTHRAAGQGRGHSTDKRPPFDVRRPGHCDHSGQRDCLQRSGSADGDAVGRPFDRSVFARAHQHPGAADDAQCGVPNDLHLRDGKLRRHAEAAERGDPSQLVSAVPGRG